MRPYSLDNLQAIMICGNNDEVIDNPFRWYADSFLQLTYNYGRVNCNGVIIDNDIPHEWMNFVDEYGFQIFKHNTFTFDDSTGQSTIK